MPSRFETAFQERTTPVAMRAFGVDVVFGQGWNTTEPFKARRNDRTFAVVGQKIKSESSVLMRDYILPAASLVINGEVIEPRPGNQVHDGNEIFELSPLDETTPCRVLLPGGYEWLVHTKRVENKEPSGRVYRGEQ